MNTKGSSVLLWNSWSGLVVKVSHFSAQLSISKYRVPIGFPVEVDVGRESVWIFSFTIQVLIQQRSFGITLGHLLIFREKYINVSDWYVGKYYSVLWLFLKSNLNLKRSDLKVRSQKRDLLPLDGMVEKLMSHIYLVTERLSAIYNSCPT